MHSSGSATGMPSCAFHINCSESTLTFTALFSKQKRSVEALKERYYSVCNRLSRAHDPNIEDSQLIAYDAPHECRRKMQLEKLLNR